MSQGHAEIDTTVWTTEDGRTLKIVDMDDSHLRNTIRFLVARRSAMALADTPKREWQRELWKRKDRVRAQHIVALQAEADRRGLQIENPQ